MQILNVEPKVFNSTVFADGMVQFTQAELVELCTRSGVTQFEARLRDLIMEAAAKHLAIHATHNAVACVTKVESESGLTIWQFSCAFVHRWA